MTFKNHQVPQLPRQKVGHTEARDKFFWVVDAAKLNDKAKVLVSPATWLRFWSHLLRLFSDVWDEPLDMTTGNTWNTNKRVRERTKKK